jgi:hypothetical protein
VTNIRPCAGLRKDGSPCAANVELPQEYCWWHDPANAEQRSRSASKAAKAKGTNELTEVKQMLRQLADDVLAGRVDRADGSVVAQILGVWLRGIEQERKSKETEEFEQRLAQLEEHQQREGGNREGGNKWWTGYGG